MIQQPRETAAYSPRSIGLIEGSDTQLSPSPAPSPKASPPSSSETLPGSSVETQLGTLPGGNPATSSPRGDGEQSRHTLTSITSGRRTLTVLPEVRSEGDELVLVPREQTRYEAASLLGRGGMGEVKLALDHDIGRKVAVKRLLDEHDPHAVARFVDEVRTVGKLEHPNIVPIHDVGVDDEGGLFFVMKYIEGETLAEVIARLAAGDPEAHASFSFERRLDIFAGVLRALQYAHDRGLVHRDIKPENIMIGRFGEVLLMDWGIAHRIRDAQLPAAAEPKPGHPSAPERADQSNDCGRATSETIDGAVIGTPQYMSPEQAAGRVAELDGRSDIYSAYAVLWELMTLTPYIDADGKNAMQQVLAVQERPLPWPTDPAYYHPRQPAVPAELRHFIRRGLHQDPRERPECAAEVLYELDRVRAGECEVNCPITLMKRTNTRIEHVMDRSPRMVMGLAALTLLSTLGGLAGWIALALS
ncbi:serine/threonine protein kinase [Pseudenhygromyxa sp. WMMC2535]|uniref:serine/threonine-protein kinase n=1 Tax=Pseudenhygromyxa sp. WMMC2535 TaxID=2712867 RepID=UPI00155168C2|nr:serine/threonine-protein kinase [Pseudenhygromyxa sp. WMMC2535]NVB37602.1 serine/threonine protein kinase [Pseudenhygromyxa sp. WMMC2535]